MTVSPLIRPEYVQPATYYDGVLGNPFKFPLDFDDSDITHSIGEMVQLCDFLHQYKDSKATLLNYTKEIEKFLQWLWRVKQRPLLKLSRGDALDYLAFIQSPPFYWIAKGSSHPKYINDNINPKWRPFTTRGNSDFKASLQSLRGSLTAVNGLYLHLIVNGHTQVNPFLGVKNPLKANTRPNTNTPPGSLGEQSEAMINNALAMAISNPSKHERTLFIIQMLAHMELKVTDLATNLKSPAPTMGCFVEINGHWKFECVGSKKSKLVDVPTSVLNALARYRKTLLLPALPSPGEDQYLLPSLRSDGSGCIQSSKQIRKIIAHVKQYKA